QRAISRPALGPKIQAAMWGAWSALAELGLVAAFFAWISKPADAGNAVGLGVGAGVFEVVILVGISLLSDDESPAKDAPPGDWFVRWSGVIERTHSIVGHAATRGLVWAAFRSWPLFPAALLGFATFAVTDGVAKYGSSKGWNWTDPRVARRAQAFFAIVSVLEAAIFAGVLTLVPSA
ncbi:MAG TPA: hypothetical protein VFC86_06900, partial [Planctomycetota bacterium]|nr:hypothetical protein [Planctomycetota bacterium]